MFSKDTKEELNHIRHISIVSNLAGFQNLPGLRFDTSRVVINYREHRDAPNGKVDRMFSQRCKEFEFA